MKVERRRFPRYQLKHRDIVAIGQKSDMLAFVRDVGPRGMQLEYFSAQPEINHWRLVDLIAARQDGSMVANIGCEIVYDMQSIVEDGSFKGSDVRQCGLCFISLSDAQELQIRLLLEKHRQQP